MSDPMTADSAFGHPSMLYAPLYNSSSIGFGEVPKYTASSVEGFDQVPLQNSRVLESPVPTVGPSSRDPYTATLPIHDQRAIVRQPENRSLFFEPLFNHTDFYLTTAVGTPGRNPNNTHQNTGPFDSQPAIPHEESFESASSFDGSTKPVNESSLRIHPNVRNHFNNLSLSSSIRVNGYPRNIQDAQIRNIFVPNWAATSLNTVPDPGGLDDAFADIYQQATNLLKDGEPLSKIFGHHPNVAALYDQQEFDRSCLLSQWAARMVHSVKRQGYDFTCFASMNVFWYVMRWTIQPSPETYAAMPEWIRPTSNQLFTPHISMADFVLWPGFRELVVQLPQLQERMAWLADMSMFINCEWPYPLEQALHRNPVSGDVDLVDLAKEAKSATYDLTSDQHDMIQLMVDYLYTGDYSVDLDGSIEDNPKCDSASLSTHAVMHSLGDKYDIEGLRSLATQKYCLELQGSLSVTNFFSSIPYVYTLTPESSRDLRDPVLAFARNLLGGEGPTTLGFVRDAIDELYVECPEFVKELFYSLLQNPLLGYCPCTGPRDTVPVEAKECRCRKCGKSGASLRRP
ncbi:uncharacterized protein FIESC28_08155 [Fusarium coffeatum]|uniref:BTB domain-containing protein n=1 Tax=Fusarium coffeatum TaxID=231269 RepID=A0A366R8P6_9HYPO|nr:uncharacterized protein FIESC28_08155 [Fusarium coffeatum]RBR13527.1 hypothetical protein FIESC28_08155 [Fusarium coffeatum]